MQCTTQREEAQIPSVSVEKAEEREDMLINKNLSEKNKKRGEFTAVLFKFY
jgi:hypothetical protein